MKGILKYFLPLITSFVVGLYFIVVFILKSVDLSTTYNVLPENIYISTFFIMLYVLLIVLPLTGFFVVFLAKLEKKLNKGVKYESS